MKVAGRSGSKNCSDQDGDGTAQTSTGPDHLLDYGKDECVAWHSETDGNIRGRAAQDFAGIRPEGVCKDFVGQEEFEEELVGSVRLPVSWRCKGGLALKRLILFTGLMAIVTTARAAATSEAVCRAAQKQYVKCMTRLMGASVGRMLRAKSKAGMAGCVAEPATQDVSRLLAPQAL